MDETLISSAEEDASGRSTIETRITDFVRLAVIVLLAYWSYTLVAPFILIVIWAAILTVALYPFYEGLRTLLGGRRRIAAFLITVVGLGIIIGPLAAIALNFVEATQWLIEKLTTGTLHFPAPSEAVRSWPLVGERIYSAWNLAATNLAGTLEYLQPTLVQAGRFILGKSAAIGLGLLSFITSIIIAGFFFGHGPKLAWGASRFAERIAGQRGIGFIRLAGATIRNVASGVIGVAIVQTLLAGLVLRFFAIPASGGLTFIILILCIIQIGPALVLLPVVIWAWATQDFTYALSLTLLLVPVAVIDNIMKPLLVSRGLSTPMLVIFMGVIGGTIAYGLIGLFLGPIVLSVFYDLLVAWVRVQVSPYQLPPPSERTVSESLKEF
ncbi:AI-2E family transporter [Rhizobium sp. PL01]|uniref:AI-2E family transporter n=1 Tax=Rhizobium sp. PL01 TaxID=3085631 RepID=UPI002981B3D2|nr:AI-2E family transporter [Rhizobium sp. PL01]MDW5317347.1 AI-2E family transporter [Rhizobium sp. PL01]